VGAFHEQVIDVPRREPKNDVQDGGENLPLDDQRETGNHKVEGSNCWLDVREHEVDGEIAPPSMHKADWDILHHRETPEALKHRHCQEL